MSTYTTLSEMEYDALGQVKTKMLAPAYNNNAGLETLDYDYNIRGWLLGANRDYVKDAASNNYFGFDLGYDKNGVLGSYTSQYNGNIAGTVWKSKGDGEKRKYYFTYDAVNRITGADFNQYTGGSFNKTAGVDFSMNNMSYDANGNITSMNQKGLKINASPLIDQLTYTYQTNSNKLSEVVDAVNDNTSTLGDFKYDPATKGSTDYSYDDNGNLTLDNNKKISGITYNYLNLPSVITVTGKGTITYTYDATGNKLKKITQENAATVPFNGTNYTSNITTTTTYIGSSVYESKAYSNSSLASLQYTDVLQIMAHEEGRIPLAIPGIKEDISLNGLKQMHDSWIEKANGFYAGAVKFFQAEQFSLCGFMLHQTTEHGLNSLLQPLMQFRMQTHNLHKLIRHSRRFSPEICNFFPRNTDTEIRLFQLLQKAYIHARYKDTFELKEEEAKILLERVQSVLQKIKEVFARMMKTDEQ